MADPQASLEKIKVKALAVLLKHNVKKAAIFGSVALGLQKKDSDIDILVELGSEASLFDLGGLKMDLEEALGKKVDLVEYVCLHPLLKEEILKQQIPVI
jgi:predicted nucleotidyltransferase